MWEREFPEDREGIAALRRIMSKLWSVLSRLRRIRKVKGTKQPTQVLSSE